jgi:hypothetical protein
LTDNKAGKPTTKSYRQHTGTNTLPGLRGNDSAYFINREDDGQTAPEADQGGPVPELRYKDIKSAAYIIAIIQYAETLLGIRLKDVKKYRYIETFREGSI